jgi:hypothetical protein
VNIKQQAGCRLHGVGLNNASPEANVRLSMPWCANSRATLFSRLALSSTTITTVGSAMISVSSPDAYLVPRVSANY